MAHPCCLCGSECDCNGDLDDCIVSKTPKNCEGCGCEEMFEQIGDAWGDDEDYDYPEEERYHTTDARNFKKEQ